MHSDCFASFWYLLAGQSVQLAAAEVVEYLPAAHSTHVVAPAAEPVFVIEPAPHAMHMIDVAHVAAHALVTL